MKGQPYHIFAIAGDKGAGKTHVANMIVQIGSVLNGGHYVGIYKFAGALKSLLASFLGNQAKYDHFKTKEVYHGMTGRELLTTVGQGLRELVHEDIWADATIREIKKFIDTAYLTGSFFRPIKRDNPYIFVIDDLRHKNELRRLHEEFGESNVTTIRIINPDSEGSKGSHISENDLNDVELDYVYYNPRSEPAGAEHLLLIIQKELANKHARMENSDEERGGSS